MNKCNFFGALDFDSDDEFEFDTVCNLNTKIESTKVNSEFFNSESTTNNLTKRQTRRQERRQERQQQRQLKLKLKLKQQQLKQQQLKQQQLKQQLKLKQQQTQLTHNTYKVYNEITDLPSSLQEAINTKQNLTLKQILILMNLHCMSGLAINVIHDKIQEKVHKMLIKICHDGRVFLVSYYHWYNLKHIESLIDKMFN
jgi:hypothetical protein